MTIWDWCMQIWKSIVEIVDEWIVYFIFLIVLANLIVTAVK